MKEQKFIPKKCKTLRATESLGPLLVLKAAMQNEGKQNQIIQAFSYSLGHTDAREGMAMAGKCPKDLLVRRQADSSKGSTWCYLRS